MPKLPSLSVGVDEFTLVLQVSEKVKVTEWSAVADAMIATFLECSKLTELFGPMGFATKVQAGYTAGLAYIDRPWYLAISWHDDFPGMGICVRFSAHAYAAYKQAYAQRYQATMNIVLFLGMIKNCAYVIRLSRIDLTADYYDYTDELLPSRLLCPDIIYERLKDGSYMVCNWKDRQSVRNMSAIDKDGAYETVYIGSRKGKTNGYLRIYDKRQEQIQSMGYRYDEALQHQSWVRFEASFLHDYAHQITSELLRSSTQDLKKLIAKYISDRYRFIDTSTGEVTAFTDDLIGIAAGVNPVALNTASPRDNTLRQSIEYLRAGSGLYATLFKTFKLWGDGADERLLKYLYDDYAYLYKAKLQMGRDKSKMREIRAWLQRHEAETKKHPLDDYLDRSEHKKYIPQYDAAGSPVVITMDGDDL